MDTFVCTSVDDATLECLEWVQTASWPALSYADAMELSAAVLGCWALAFGLRLIFGHLLNR